MKTEKEIRKELEYLKKKVKAIETRAMGKVSGLTCTLEAAINALKWVLKD